MFNRFLSLTRLVFSAFIVLILSGCGAIGNSAKEASITYEITYPTPFEDKLMSSLMPSEMDVKFKDNLLKTELSFAMGMIRVSYLSDAERLELYEMMKFMNQKNYAIRSQADVNTMIQKIPAHDIKLGTGTKVIAGYNCKNATVHVKNDSTDYNFELWYTEELGIPAMNWCSPFWPVKGVLMEYQVERYDIMMKFSAKEVTLSKFEEDEFSIPEKYKKISFEEMEEKMLQLKEI